MNKLNIQNMDIKDIGINYKMNEKNKIKKSKKLKIF